MHCFCVIKLFFNEVRFFKRLFSNEIAMILACLVLVVLMGMVSLEAFYSFTYALNHISEDESSIENTGILGEGIPGPSLKKSHPMLLKEEEERKWQEDDEFMIGLINY